MLPALRGAVRRLALAARPVRQQQQQRPHLGGGAKRMMGGASGAPHHHQPKQVRWAVRSTVDRSDRLNHAKLGRGREKSRISADGRLFTSIPTTCVSLLHTTRARTHTCLHTQAFLFNEGPGPRKVEIWEPITSITCELDGCGAGRAGVSR